MIDESNKINSDTSIIIKESNKKRKLNITLEDYLEDTKDKLNLYLNAQQIKDEKKLKSFLRNRFSVSCNLAIEEGKLSPSSFQNDEAVIHENAHIISMQYLLQDEINITKLEDAASPYNCLRLSPNLHKAFDKNKITFNTEGRIEGYNENKFISIDIKNHLKRKEYIKINYENWLKFKRNMQ